MHWMVDAAFYIMVINSETTEMALSVSSSACLWHDEFTYHFYKSDVHAGIFVSCLEVLCADLPLMLLVYQVYEIDFCQYKQVGFEYGHEKSQLLYKQKRT